MRFQRKLICVVSVVAALAAATPAFAQRMSLADRVTQLENKANAEMQSAGQANLEMQNRMVELQAEVQSLRNLVESLQNENEQLKQRAREQYIDLDGRLARLEGGDAATAATPNSSAAPAAAAAAASAPARRDEPAAAPAPADPANEEAAYQAALDTLVERFEAAESARQFQAFLADYPESPLVPNAWYWLGESYYVTQNYQLALDAFQTLLVEFPGSRKEADALLKQAYCQIALDDIGGGEATLRDLAGRYPGTDAASKAESRLRTLARESR